MKIDHGFKFPDRIVAPTPGGGREHPFAALFSALDEYGRIVLYQLCKTKALRELRPSLLALKERHKLQVCVECFSLSLTSIAGLGRSVDHLVRQLLR